MTNEQHTTITSYGAAEGTTSSYVVGFVLSIALTLVPYHIASNHLLSGYSLLYVISAFAVIQLFVQLVFFLHLNTKSEKRWNLIAALLTIFMVAFLVIGTIWIMQNLNYNTMNALTNNMEELLRGN